MNDPNQRLKSVVFREIDRLERASDRSHINQPNGLLGTFVDAALSNRDWTRAQLAQKLDMDDELLDAILDGILTSDEVGNHILANIARILGYELNVLLLLMGRHIEPTRSATHSK